MSNLNALILGIIQGLTEFLPVSSSAHLVIFQQFFKIDSKQLTMFFDVTVHLGTLLAILICYFGDVYKISASFFKNIFKPALWKESFSDDINFRIGIYILISTFITGLIGLPFKDSITMAFDKPKFAAVCLIFTGLILFISEKLHKKSKMLIVFNIKDAIVLGLIQSIALLPGISRSGTTIACALVLGFAQSEAAKYSFLLAIPAIAGAFTIELVHIINSGFHNAWITPLSCGFIMSMITGILAIKLIMLVLKEKKLYLFSIYCWIIAFFVLFFMNV